MPVRRGPGATYDIGDPVQPHVLGSGAIRQAQMVKATAGNQRPYVSHSPPSELGGQGPYARPPGNVTAAGLVIDPKFEVDFEHLPTGQARPHDMLLK